MHLILTLTPHTIYTKNIAFDGNAIHVTRVKQLQTNRFVRAMFDVTQEDIDADPRFIASQRISIFNKPAEV